MSCDQPGISQSVRNLGGLLSLSPVWGCAGLRMRGCSSEHSCLQPTLQQVVPNYYTDFNALPTHGPTGILQVLLISHSGTAYPNYPIWNADLLVNRQCRLPLTHEWAGVYRCMGKAEGCTVLKTSSHASAKVWRHVELKLNANKHPCGYLERKNFHAF